MAQSDAGNSTPLETKHRRHWPVWVAGLVLFGAMAVSSWQLWFARQAYYSDADTIKQPADTAVLRDILWQPPQRLAELINTLEDDYEPRPSADGRLLYLVRGKAGENADIYCCERTLEGWSRAAPLERINSEFDDLGPEPSEDGKKIYFYSDRPGGSGGRKKPLLGTQAKHQRWDAFQPRKRPITRQRSAVTARSDRNVSVRRAARW